MVKEVFMNKDMEKLMEWLRDEALSSENGLTAEGLKRAIILREVRVKIWDIITPVECAKCLKTFNSEHEEHDYVQKYGFCVRCEDIEKDIMNDNSKPAEMGDSAEDFLG